MSVRRLAEDAVQPAYFAFSSDNEAWAGRLIDRYPPGRQQSAVIPLLMRAQDQDGWVTKAAIEHVADRLAMPLIRVLEVATFYTQFQLKPVGTRAHVQVCGTTPCMLRGADALKEVCRSKIHHDQFHTSADGTLSWEEVECLGACVNAPMVMVFKDTYEDLTPERLGDIIDALGRGEEVKPGPQIDRHLSVPFGGLTTLDTFDDDEDVGGREDGLEHSGAAPQGSGTGGPSQAGRVDTHAAETDPSIDSPGAERGSGANQTADDAASQNPAAGAGPGAGREGGTQQGPTGAADGELDEEYAASGRDGSPSARLPAREGAAEERVVDHKFRPKADAPPVGTQAASVDPSQTQSAEAKRAGTSDTKPRESGNGADGEAGNSASPDGAGTDGSRE